MKVLGLLALSVLTVLTLPSCGQNFKSQTASGRPASLEPHTPAHPHRPKQRTMINTRQEYQKTVDVVNDISVQSHRVIGENVEFVFTVEISGRNIPFVLVGRLNEEGATDLLQVEPKELGEVFAGVALCRDLPKCQHIIVDVYFKDHNNEVVRRQFESFTPDDESISDNSSENADGSDLRSAPDAEEGNRSVLTGAGSNSKNPTGNQAGDRAQVQSSGVTGRRNPEDLRRPTPSRSSVPSQDQSLSGAGQPSDSQGDKSQTAAGQRPSVTPPASKVESQESNDNDEESEASPVDAHELINEAPIEYQSRPPTDLQKIQVMETVHSPSIQLAAYEISAERIEEIWNSITAVESFEIPAVETTDGATEEKAATKPDSSRPQQLERTTRATESSAPPQRPTTPTTAAAVERASSVPTTIGRPVVPPRAPEAVPRRQEPLRSETKAPTTTTSTTATTLPISRPVSRPATPSAPIQSQSASPDSKMTDWSQRQIPDTLRDILAVQTSEFLNLYEDQTKQGRPKNQAYGYYGSGNIKNAEKVVRSSDILNLDWLTDSSQYRWGTSLVGSFLEFVSARFAQMYTDNPVIINRVSLKSGGFTGGGQTFHQNGLDIDISYPSKNNKFNFLNVIDRKNKRVFPDHEIVERTMALLVLMDQTKAVNRFYVDEIMKNELIEHAKAIGKLEDYRETLTKTCTLIDHHHHIHVSLWCTSFNVYCRNMSSPPTPSCPKGDW